MEWLAKEEGFETINKLSRERIPFLFVISYDQNKIFAQPLENLEEGIFYKLEDWRNYAITPRTKPFAFSLSPIDFQLYNKAFEAILEEIRSGNTYLLNLTFKTPITSDLSLKEIFIFAKAKFKLYFKDQFICFSPERFVEMEGETISTYPMKGTIDANIPDAKAMILSDQKEMAEHTMIVDLMRNDLGIICSNIGVEKFRYVEEIEAGGKQLFQVSSKITAKLPKNWKDEIGTLLKQLLPAGSITGTPKKKTTEIIEAIENYERGFYTGVFGIFDGNTLRSSVMIRFVEKDQGNLFYKSGGGITIDSDVKNEYQEMIDKIYLPL
ncbi:MAG: hypothetical protein RL113_826 [Pseudomonadota bacterium]